MHLDPFELHRPASVGEAVELTRKFGPACDLLAGGTDLLPNYKMHLNVKRHLVALGDVAELRTHSLERIGAMTRLGELERDTAFRATYPGLAEAIGEVATPLVRASATVGGNLLVETRCFFFNQSYFWRDSLGYCLKADGDRCHVVPQKERCYATFSGDLAPALGVLNASIEIAGPTGLRTVNVLDLYDAAGDGIRRHHLAEGEIVTAILLPDSARRVRSTYRKLRIRPTFDFPELGIAASLDLDGSRVRALAIAAGGLETYPKRFDEFTAPLVGAPLTAEAITAIADQIMRSVRPVYNTFLAPDYRKRMVAVYVRRALEHLSGVRAEAAG
ncbi:MAG: FAD binding domain-containing protein [Thermoplasmata archaeon]|nr:FAD binding domain-containing protein [Thermoplasmata archaeon]